MAEVGGEVSALLYCPLKIALVQARSLGKRGKREYRDYQHD